MRQKSMFLFATTVALLVSCGSKPSMKFGDNKYPVVQIKSTGSTTQTTYPAVTKGIQDVGIRLRVSEFTTKLDVKEGQVVDKGQVLFVIGNSTYQASVRQMQVAVNSAKPQLNATKLAYENSEQLLKSNVIGQYELQSTQNTCATARVAMAQVQAALASAKKTLSFCYVEDPAAGVIGGLPFEVGALVSASSPTPSTTASDNSTIEVYFSMTEENVLEMTKISGNVSAVIASVPVVKLQTADGMICNQPGKAVKMGGTIDQVIGILALMAHFENPNWLLRGDGSGSIVIPQVSNHAIAIPQSYAAEVQDKIFVYTVGKDSRVEYMEIKVAPQDDGQNCIVTEGLKVGDRIVTNGITKLSDDMGIRPITQAQYVEKTADTEKPGEIQGDYGKMKGAFK